MTEITENIITRKIKEQPKELTKKEQMQVICQYNILMQVPLKKTYQEMDTTSLFPFDFLLLS